VAAALAAMKWLVGYGCACGAELHAWESMAELYRDPNFDLYELAELRTSGIGPEVASVARPVFDAHAEGTSTRMAQICRGRGNARTGVAGARKLAHRTQDAVEMLHHDEFEAVTVLAYLPLLDLDATLPLCTSSLSVLHERFARVYRPNADNPRS